MVLPEGRAAFGPGWHGLRIRQEIGIAVAGYAVERAVKALLRVESAEGKPVVGELPQVAEGHGTQAG